MSNRISYITRLAWLIVLNFGLSVATLAEAPAASDLADAERALQTAQEEEKAAENEWNSREMARSATREIARSERQRSEEALRNLRAAKATVQERQSEIKAALQAANTEHDAGKKQALLEAAIKGQVEVDAAQQQLDQRMAALRTASERLMADSRAADKATRELLVAEHALRDKMAATRRAESLVAQLKAREAAKTATENPDVTRTVAELQAITAWENQLWAGVQRNTLNEFLEQTTHTAQLTWNLVCTECDQPRRRALEIFAYEQTAAKTEAENLIKQKTAEIEAAAATIYPLRAAAMGGLKPLPPECWDYAKARHLLGRAGFGGTPQEVDSLCGQGLYKAVDSLVAFYAQPPADAPLDVTPLPPQDSLEARLRNDFIRSQAAAMRNGVESHQFARLRQWWLKRMVESPRPLQEKLTLFWHGLFANQYSVVQSSYAIYQQNRLFREHATGNYGALLYAMVHDPSMIRYLDNHQNIKGKPNENLGREILELFSMGVDQGYTEQDIVQAARALTGYTYDNRSGGFRYIHEQHDTGEKTIFGKTGQWTGDDLVRLILEQPATAKFIARRLWEYFAYTEPQPEIVERLAGVLRANNYELEPVLRNLFLSEEFYSDRAIGHQIKSPVELVVGTLRELGVKQVTDYGRLDTAVREMGLELFEPPDVKGWRYGRPWISSARIFERYNSTADLIRSVSQRDCQGVDVLSFVLKGGCRDKGDVIEYLAKTCLSKPLSPEKKAALLEYLATLPPCSEWEKQRNEINPRLQELLILMVSMPEYQIA
jgi:hypothetical protein